MDIKDVRNIAMNIKGEEYYGELNTLKDDLKFFQMFIRRNQNSKRFGFRIIPIEFPFTMSLPDIYKATGFYDENLEDTYAIFIVLKAIILDLYKETNIYTNEEINRFNAFLRNDYGLEMKDYIGDFVGCSHGCGGVAVKLMTILGEDIGND